MLGSSSSGAASDSEHQPSQPKSTSTEYIITVCVNILNIIVAIIITRVLLFTVHTLMRPQKLGKGSVIVDELIVRADLCDLAICHHHYDITLREKPNPMSHKKTNLNKRI